MKHLIRRISIALALLMLFMGAPRAKAQQTGTIDLDRNVAWGENLGFTNFAPSNSSGAYEGLVITDTAITGVAWSSVYGFIDFGPAHSGQGVTNTTAGVLGGSAWSSGLGFIDMTGATIDAGGEFRGTVGSQGTTAGRLSFDCAQCDVHTTWRPTAAPAQANPPASPSPTLFGSSGSKVTLAPDTTTAGPTPSAGDSGFGQASQQTGGPLRTVPGGSLVGSASTSATSSIPAELFDISMFLDNNTIPMGADVTARVEFVNFGSTPTPIALSFSISNATGKIVATSSVSLTVETERSYEQTFSNLDLPPGNYSVHLHTKYNKDVEDDFYRPFSVVAGAAGISMRWIAAILAFTAAFLLFLFIILKRRKRAKDIKRHIRST